MYRFLLILFFLTAVSCGINRQLHKSFSGKPISIASDKFGKPKTIIEKNGEKVYVFEVIKKLESTEIAQGKLTLDPMVTPQVIKTERYYFTVKDRVIVKTKYEEEYER
jgi:hypothetical protein